MVLDENTQIENLIEELRKLNKSPTHFKVPTVIALSQTLVL